MRPIIVSPGVIQAPDESFCRMEESALWRNMVIYGAIGSGKTKLLELLMRQLESQGEGYSCVSPHPDLAGVQAQYHAALGRDPGRTLHLRFGLDSCPRLDPFAGLPEGVPFMEYEAALISRCDLLYRACVRNLSLAEQDMMKLLRANFFARAYVAGFRVDGKYAGFDKMLTLAEPDDPECEAIVERVRTHIRSADGIEVMRRMDKLKRLKTEKQRSDEIGSYVNLMQTILHGPIPRKVFTPGPSIDFRRIIRDRFVVVLDLGERDELSNDAAKVIGGMYIALLLSTAKRTPEEDRVQHYLFIDEAESYIGEDVRQNYAELRKFRLSTCCVFQDRSATRRGDLELTDRIENCSGIKFCLRMGNPDDIEYLAKSFGYGGLDTTALMVDQVLPRGYRWVPSEAVAEMVQESESQAQSLGTSAGTSRSRTNGAALAKGEQESETASKTKTKGSGLSLTSGNTESEGENEGEQHSVGVNHTEGMTKTEGDTVQDGTTEGESINEHATMVRGGMNGKSAGKTTAPDGKETEHAGGSSASTWSASAGTAKGKNSGRSHVVGRQTSTGQSASDGIVATDGVTIGKSRERGRNTGVGVNLSSSASDGTAKTRGKSSTLTISASETEGENFTMSLTLTSGTSTSHGRTVTRSLIPLQEHEIVKVPTGGPVKNIDFQFAVIMKCMASLPDRYVLMKAKDIPQPLLVRIHDVLDPWEMRGIVRSPEFKCRAVEHYLKRIRATHPCYFSPALSAI